MQTVSTRRRLSDAARDAFREIQPRALDDPTEIREILERAFAERIPLTGALDRALREQTTTLDAVDEASLWFDAGGLELDGVDALVLNLPLDGHLFVFATECLETEGSRLRVAMPTSLFVAERRERARRVPGPGDPCEVEVRDPSGAQTRAGILDLSLDGVGLQVAATAGIAANGELAVRFLDGDRGGEELFGQVRSRRKLAEAPGWQRFGMSLSAARRGASVAVESRDTILAGGRLHGAWQRVGLWGAGARASSGRTLRRVSGRPARPPVEVIEFENAQGERIKAAVDSCGERRGAPLVLMPPAWAKTKETLLPLARTIVETFRREGEPVTVARLDGIRRRGESHNDPECGAPGHECHHMTFSQGMRDVCAALDFFEKSRDFGPRTVILVTFSGASIEARRALATSAHGRVGGWVSVVGAADLKHGLRTVSGGIDFIAGRERGVTFGIQRVLGIEVDMDRVADDAIASEIAYLEDARRDMMQIDIPITWIRGRYDAWIDPDRVDDMLSCGDTRARRIIEVPTGHQMRTSSEAIETFQLIAQEIGRQVLGREVKLTRPDLGDVERRRKAERARLPKRDTSVRDFWRDYLLGRDRTIGMEILTASSPYRQLLQAQMDRLSLTDGARLADLGTGTGALPAYLNECRPVSALSIDAFDYVPEALARAKALAREFTSGYETRFLQGDLDLVGDAAHIPVPDARYDAVAASLLLNYVAHPEALLREIHRILRPGGALVLSTLRPDTDISNIYADVAAEVASGEILTRLAGSASVASQVGPALRAFLNEAARLIELEEDGVFRFWDADELVRLVQESGFAAVETDTAFGDPPQAIVLRARRP